MDLRFHKGGNSGEVLDPGSTIIAKMEFFGMDVVIPAEDGFHLIITQSGEDYIPSPISTQPVSISIDSNSVLGLSTITRSCGDFFLPPMHEIYDDCA